MPLPYGTEGMDGMVGKLVGATLDSGCGDEMATNDIMVDRVEASAPDGEAV